MIKTIVIVSLFILTIAEVPQIKITIGAHEYIANLENSTTSCEFGKTLPRTLSMSDFNSNEKYYRGDKLTSKDEKYSKINAGDLMLYSSNTIVLFYKTFDTSYSYTPIGKIVDATGIESAVGSGNIEVSYEMYNSNITSICESNSSTSNITTNTQSKISLSIILYLSMLFLI